MSTTKFSKLFKKTKNVVIGMLHVPALPGCPKNTLSVEKISQHVLKEADKYANGNVDSMMIENMHDVPYIKSPNLGPEIVAAMTTVATLLRENFPEVPLGIQILTGGSKEAVAVAKCSGLNYIRSEGFVYSHIGDEGWIDSCAGDLLRYRKMIDAEDILIFTDIKKKHSSHAITSDVDLIEATRSAEFFLTDGIIITGNETGDPAVPCDVKKVFEDTNLPILLGSGVTIDNVEDYSQSSSGYIIGTHFKEKSKWFNPVDLEKVKMFVEKVNKLK